MSTSDLTLLPPVERMTEILSAVPVPSVGLASSPAMIEPASAGPPPAIALAPVSLEAVAVPVEPGDGEPAQKKRRPAITNDAADLTPEEAHQKAIEEGLH